MKRILVCPDSFKGTMTATEAASAIAGGLREAVAEARIIELPIADGGEGTVDVLARTMEGIEKVTCRTTDPLGRGITASYAILRENTAIVESASASGLTLVKREERDIMKADTYGSGLLLADAFNRGIRNFIIGMGGTATCDGGKGALEALRQLAPGLWREETRFTLLCDVDNPFCGPQGAAEVFAPQKGATREMIPVLEKRLRERAKEYAEFRGIDPTSMKFAGAAGGLAGMFMACFDAKPVSGIEKVLELTGFHHRVEEADLVITGEGKCDRTTLSGKAPKGILEGAAKKGVPVVMVAGRVADRETLLNAGFAGVVEATPLNPDPDISPAEYLHNAIKEYFSNHYNYD